MNVDTLDPKGLIRESYRIDAITIEQCRSIFLDWALSLPEDIEPRAAIVELLATYGDWIDHPMSKVMREGASATFSATRRGGRAARLFKES